MPAKSQATGANGVPTNTAANAHSETTAAASKNLSENIVKPSKEVGLINILLHEKEIHYTDYFTLIARPYIEFQYKLINERTTWYIGLQAFFFAAFGFTIQKRAELIVNKFTTVSECSARPAACEAIASLDSEMVAISLAGILLSALVWGLILAASNPVRHMFDIWETEVWSKLQQKSGKDTTQPMPLLTGGTKRRHARAGLRWTKVVPMLVGAIWVYILYATEIGPWRHGTSFLAASNGYYTRASAVSGTASTPDSAALPPASSPPTAPQQPNK